MDDKELLTNTIKEISQDINRFDSTKYPCDQIGNAFNACPCLKYMNIKQAYIWLLILLNRFHCNLERLELDNDNQKNNKPGDLNALSHITIRKLDAL